MGYLKKTIGKPLALALAEVTTKKPRDPIHYLAHWLIKYRYNKEVQEAKEMEIEELCAERTRIAQEMLVNVKKQYVCTEIFTYNCIQRFCCTLIFILL